MFKIRTVILFVVVLTLVAVLAPVAYFKMTTSVSFPIVNTVLDNVALASGSANPSAAHSVYMSEQSIRHILDQAYEQHRWGTREQALLRILNGRYENRNGLPR